jgi:hypothetical protein
MDSLDITRLPFSRLIGVDVHCGEELADALEGAVSLTQRVSMFLLHLDN